MLWEFINMNNWRYFRGRISRNYHQTLHELCRTDFQSEEYWSDWHFKRIKALLIFVEREIPYYKKIFNSLELVPAKLKSIEEFKDYPYLTKDLLRNNTPELLLSRKKLSKTFTGGTSGVPVELYRDFNDFTRESAVTSYIYKTLELNPNSRILYIRGPFKEHRGRLYYFTNFGKMLRISPLCFTNNHFEKITTLIQRFNPEILLGTPSMIILFCQYFLKLKLDRFKNLKCAFTTSENLYNFQVEFIEEVLDVPVHSSYGQSEHVVSAWKCNHSNFYHVIPSYGITELIDKNGKEVNKEGEIGEIVGTAFTNYSFPLIRYRTNDYAIFTNKECSCGRNYKSWTRIIGRDKELLVTRNGSFISGQSLFGVIYSELGSLVRLFRVEQWEAGKIQITLYQYNISDYQMLHENLLVIIQKHYPDAFSIEIKKCNDFEFTDQGKFRYFIQHMEKFS
jgi:phenylacetate-CoA ligase